MKIVTALVMLAVMLSGCAREISTEPPAYVPDAQVTSIPIAEGRELFALVEKPEEAEEIAALYGIELVECSDGVAIFHTDRAPEDVISTGEKNGWPQLEINSIQRAIQ